MRDIKDKIAEAKKNELPKLRHLKKVPEWCMSYPDFHDRIEEIWDEWKDGDRGFIATMVYFMTGDEDAEDYGWSMIEEKIKSLYHK